MAKKTIGDCIGDARTILQDKSTPYRYTDDELYSAFNNGLNELKRLRPDAFVGSYGTDLTIYTSSDSATELPVAMIFFQPLVYFVTGFAELRDDEFAVEGRAAILLRSFSAQLTSVAGAMR
ncbi:MAG: hypothetical protein R3260_03485 [Pseudomonas sp.]|nr:hypothetical protein [Pseudomonas sp.]